MPLPDNFSPFEHLQSVIQRLQNQIVRKDFADLGDDTWEPDISTGRGSLRVACTLVDGDNANMLLMRLWLYYIILKKAADLQVPVYGIPVTTHQETWTFQPQIKFYFLEDADDVEPTYSPVFREVTIRLQDETSETITKAKATTFANKINTELGKNGGHRFHTGWHKATYLDKPNGFDFRLLTYDKAQAKELIASVMTVVGKVPDWKYLNYIERDEPSQAFPVLQPARNIYGRFRRAPRKRPVAWVRFRRAELLLHGLTHPLVLVDLTGAKPDLRN